jgi:DNA-binding NarL/FixJ family response regulator
VDQVSDKSAQSRTTARIRTLVVEDSPPAMRAMVNLLETDPAIEVLATAADGEAALELAGKLHPDLVIADMELPGISGLAMTEVLRKRFPGICVVLISVHDGFTWQQLSRMKGADAFLSKHRLHAELLELVERLFPARALSTTAEAEPCTAK